MNPLIEHRMYEKHVRCDVCLLPTTSCVFYCCVCTHTQIKICRLCSFQEVIKGCIMCTEDDEEEINFYRYF